MGHRSTEWCPRCGTSLSQHELTQAGVYQDRADPSLFVRLPLLDRHGESLVVWTTTPWTLPANVAVAVHPDERVRPPRERRMGRASAATPTTRSSSACAASELVGWRYAGPFDDLPPGSQVEHRVVPWDEVSLEEGTGLVHIAPGCGGEDFELCEAARPARADAGRRVGPLLRRLRLAARPLDDRGCRPDHRRASASAASSSRPAIYTHAYPHCWRCDTPLIFRLSDDWFIAVDELRPTAARGEREGRVGARVHGQAHGRLAAQHGRLEHLAPPLLRPAAAVLPVRVRAPERDRLEGRARASGRSRGSTSSRSYAGRGSTVCRSAASRAARLSSASSRSATSGSTRGSSRSRRSAGRTRSGSRRATRTGAAKGLTTADLPDHAYWEEWFPADWVSEMREQIRLWFYSQFFMSVVLVGRSPYKRVLGYEKMLDENGPRDARLLGEHDPGRGRVRADGRRRDALAVLRAAARPQPALRLRAGARDQAAAAHVLELGQVPRRLRQHRGLRAVAGRSPSRTASCGRSTAGWSSGRSSSSPTRPTATRRR